jgi:hypothetical protein
MPGDAMGESDTRANADGAPDGVADSLGNVGDVVDSAVSAPEIGAAEVADLAQAYETGGHDGTDSPTAGDTAADASSPDGRSGLTCPTTINGSLDSTDLTQLTRHYRYAPASTCGSSKTFPGNGADIYAHLYDIYHFVNPGVAAVCFNFNLTYPGAQLYAAAYSSFDPTNITTGYLGDAGGILGSPQTMGITVGAGATIDVVVYAIAYGTSPAGSYTLSCSTH